MMNSIELSLFSSRITAVCSEMGVVLQGAAFSPNIRDRLDYSCAVFDLEGELCAQAAHIPVHLGSMAYAMRDIVMSIDWLEGDMVIVNNPYLGGTHLPDVTVIAPVFHLQQLVAYVANRAHHADIGAESPGSMPISKSLEEEGIIISPSHIQRQGKIEQAIFQKIILVTHNTDVTRGDFAAQMSANNTGVMRLLDLINSMSEKDSAVFKNSLVELNNYANRIADSALKQIPDGEYQFSDVMDDDGMGSSDIIIKVKITIKQGNVHVDFAGTANQVSGNINCPLSVAAAGVYYVFRCLMPNNTPACSGTFKNIKLTAPEGCLLNAVYPAAVAAGNVETSTRVVDVVLGALSKAMPDKIPAASHGSMNNLAMGSRGYTDQQNQEHRGWDYYETIGGGMGAGPEIDGLSGVQTHMTNTRNTPIEVLESHYPLRISQYALRSDSAGHGIHNGGEGLIREYVFLAPTNVTLLTERRVHQPWGIQEGNDAKIGENRLNNKLISAKINIEVSIGDILTIKTPGGGGYGRVE